MSYEIEIEYKVMLSEEEFILLSNHLPFPAKSVLQTNYYFETDDFVLKKFHSALRIREKDNSFTLTLKQPHPDGMLEINDKLSEKEFLSWINGKPIAKEHTANQLKELGIPIELLIYYGCLQTERKSFRQNNVEYVLDKSTYNGIVDYELEIEAPTKSIGLSTFNHIIEAYQITKKDPITKIERFFRTLS